MKNLEQLLKKVEKNYTYKNKREKTEFTLNGEIYEVLTLTRDEKFDLMFSRHKDFKTYKDIYEWIKPFIYKTYQLKELALKAKEEGYINTYLEVVDMLFEADSIPLIVEHLFEINNLQTFKNEVLKLQKKQ